MVALNLLVLAQVHYMVMERMVRVPNNALVSFTGQQAVAGQVVKGLLDLTLWGGWGELDFLAWQFQALHMCLQRCLVVMVLLCHPKGISLGVVQEESGQVGQVLLPVWLQGPLLLTVITTLQLRVMVVVAVLAALMGPPTLVAVGQVGLMLVDLEGMEDLE
jgi:hypothetical protein